MLDLGDHVDGRRLLQESNQFVKPVAVVRDVPAEGGCERQRRDARKEDKKGGGAEAKKEEGQSVRWRPW